MGGQSHSRTGSLESRAVCTTYTLATASSVQVPYLTRGKATATHHPPPSISRCRITSGEEDGEAGGERSR